MPIIGRIEKERVLLDARTLRDVLEEELISSIVEAMERNTFLC